MCGYPACECCAAVREELLKVGIEAPGWFAFLKCVEGLEPKACCIYGITRKIRDP